MTPTIFNGETKNIGARVEYILKKHLKTKI